VSFDYVSTDGKGFDDYAWARVVDAGGQNTVAWLFTARSSNSITPPRVPVCIEYQEELKNAFERVWLGKQKPEDALRAVQERMQPKNDKMLDLIERRLQKGIYKK